MEYISEGSVSSEPYSEFEIREEPQLTSSVYRAGLRFSHFELSESVAMVDWS
jgi:hypothetical protein